MTTPIEEQRREALEALEKFKNIGTDVFAINGVHCKNTDGDTVFISKRKAEIILSEIRSALQENMGEQKCEAVGNEYCWKHDRQGKECHASPTTPPSMEAELVEALERIRKNTCCDTCREAAIVAGDALIKYRSRK